LLFASTGVPPTVRATHTGDDFGAYGDCVYGGGYNAWAGMFKASPATNRQVGVRAYIDPDVDFHACTQANSWPWDRTGASSAWVGLEIPNSASSILQIGVVHCGWVDDGGLCETHHDQLRYFWAYGGCNGAVPYPRDLGAADWNQHHFMISRQASGYLNLIIDQVYKEQIHETHSGIGCWTRTNPEAIWSGEQWDAGDGWGRGSFPSRFTQSHFRRISDGVWQNNAWNSAGTCDFNTSISYPGSTFCDVTGATNFAIWTDFHQ